MPHFPLFHNILSYFCTLFQHIFGNFCTLFYLILKQGRQSGQAKWQAKWAGKCLSCFCFSPCYNAILNTAFFTLPASPDRTQGLCASPGRSMASSPARRSNRDALPSFQNRISASGSYSVSGVGSGCSVTQICSLPCRIHWISAYLLCVSKRQSPQGFVSYS